MPYRGSLASIVFQLVGGLRAGMGYTGCRTIPELREKSRFVRIHLAGNRESHVHDVIITEKLRTTGADPGPPRTDAGAAWANRAHRTAPAFAWQVG